MRTNGLSLVLAVLVSCLFGTSFGQSCAGTRSSCSGVRSTPVRTFVQSRPVASFIQKLSVRAQASCGSSAQASCSGSQAASCAGSAQATGCTGSMAVVVQAAPVAPTAACNCGCEQGNACTCSGTCSVAESHAQFNTPVRNFLSSAYQQALASAQYRANNRIHGHSYLDTHRTSGVGWATSDATPNTCLGRGGANYAVVRGTDGWYATKFAQ